MRHHHKPFGCPKPMDTVVYPTKYNEVHTCSQSDVKHVHPSHTNVVNHHLVKNTHVFPHSTSYHNTVDSVDVYGGSYQVPRPPRPNVSGPQAAPFQGGPQPPRPNGPAPQAPFSGGPQPPRPGGMFGPR